MSNYRPVCVNHNCYSPVVYSGVDKNGNKKWRVHCSNCQKASYGSVPHAPGVVPFKTGICSNVGGKLGFRCCINWELAKSQGLKFSTEVDHINGDSSNNHPENLQELCPMCHKEKGKRSGDYDGFRRFRTNPKSPPPSSALILSLFTSYG